MGNSFVIKGNICQTINSKELDLHENSYAVCVDGISKGVFDALPEEYASLPFFDYGDKLVFPGMVDLHIHAPQYAFRGMCMDLELMEWLNQYTFPEEEKYENLEYAEKAYGMFVDALKNGATTRACIFATRHRFATELLMKLMEESGLVSYVGKVNMDREASEALTEDSAEISAYTTFGWINAVKDKFKNTKPILTPRFIPCCTDKLMEELREIQMAYNEAHGIVPKTIKKDVREILEISRKEPDEKKPAKYLSPKERELLIKRLTAEMKQAAKLLEFEQAAKLRDRIEKLRKK